MKTTQGIPFELQGIPFELQRALVTGSEECLKQFLSHYPESLEAKNIDGNTPLIIAAEYGHANIVKILIDKKANIEATNNNGQTPLIIAAE